MKSKWDAVFTVTLVVCALTTTALVVHRQFFAPATAAAPDRPPVLLRNWKSPVAESAQFGSPDAPVQLTEFADFECPACAAFHQTLKILRARYPTQVALAYVHFPLPMHRFALPAARVAECAGEQGRFEAMHDGLFEDQYSFGIKPWRDYATAAGVPDLAAFDACIQKTDSVSRIAAAQRLGTQLDIKETPTVIINGWRLSHPPSVEELDVMVKAVLAGKSPITPPT